MLLFERNFFAKSFRVHESQIHSASVCIYFEIILLLPLNSLALIAVSDFLEVPPKWNYSFRLRYTRSSNNPQQLETANLRGERARKVDNVNSLTHTHTRVPRVYLSSREEYRICSTVYRVFGPLST